MLSDESTIFGHPRSRRRRRLHPPKPSFAANVCTSFLLCSSSTSPLVCAECAYWMLSEVSALWLIFFREATGMRGDGDKQNYLSRRFELCFPRETPKRKFFRLCLRLDALFNPNYIIGFFCRGGGKPGRMNERKCFRNQHTRQGEEGGGWGRHTSLRVSRELHVKSERKRGGIFKNVWT